MYKIELTSRVRKELKRLDKRFKGKVSVSIQLLKTNPLMGEKMGGEFQGSYRIKIPPIRIIYTPDHKNKIIFVRAIGHRQGVYR